MGFSISTTYFQRVYFSIQAACIFYWFIYFYAPFWKSQLHVKIGPNFQVDHSCCWQQAYNKQTQEYAFSKQQKDLWRNGKCITQILSENEVCWVVSHSRPLEEGLCDIDNQACVFKPSLNNSCLPCCAPLHNNICSQHTSQTITPKQKPCCLCVLAALCSSTLPKYFYTNILKLIFSLYSVIFSIILICLKILS